MTDHIHDIGNPVKQQHTVEVYTQTYTAVTGTVTVTHTQASRHLVPQTEAQ